MCRVGLLPNSFSYFRPQSSMTCRRKMYFLHLFLRGQFSHFKRYLSTVIPVQFERENYLTMAVKVVSSGARFAPKSVILECHGMRYLFNCGDSVERILREANSTKLRSVFITSLSWENLAGLPSLVLMAQQKQESLHMYGPKGADELMAASENFLNRYRRGYEFKSLSQLGTTTYPALTINPVIIRSTDESPYRELPGSIWPRYKSHLYRYIKDEMSSSSPHEPMVQMDVSIAYICSSIVKRSSVVSCVKCAERGLKPGPLVAQLQRGKSITLEDGTVLAVEDVIADRSYNNTTIVVECPTVGFLDSLLSADAFKEFQVPLNSNRKVLVVHLSPLNVMKDPRYIQWMHLFPPTVNHLVVNEINSCIGYGTMMWRQNLMHLLNSRIFLALRGVKLKSKIQPGYKGKVHNFTKTVVDEFVDTCLIHDLGNEMAGDKVKENELTSVKWRERWGSEATDLKLIEARFGTIFTFSSNKVERYKEAWWNDGITQFFKDSVPLVKETIADLKETYKECGIDQEANPKEQFPQVLFLGTSATAAVRYRNVSSILLKVSQDKSILMDCGEGTLRQLYALYEQADLQKVLCSLRAVYISHLHADHHLGLISLLQARKTALAAVGNVSQPLMLLAPHTIADWLSLIHSYFTDILSNVIFVPLKDIDIDSSNRSRAVDDLFLDLLEMKLVNICAVEHCIFSYGVSFTHKDGWKITYSGDTMYCDKLIEIGTNSDLLIHEATFENSLKAMAIAKRHSTTYDAVMCGKKMNAKFTILTHFSQRYHLPAIAELISMNKPNVSISFDFMMVNLQDLPTLPLLHPAYLKLFKKRLDVQRKKMDRLSTRYLS